jgi:hypothetical protein
VRSDQWAALARRQLSAMCLATLAACVLPAPQQPSRGVPSTCAKGRDLKLLLPSHMLRQPEIGHLRTVRGGKSALQACISMLH